MIRITKPSAPAVLALKGAAKRDAHCQDYLQYREEYDAGRKFDFDARIYAHRMVKQVLMRAQHNKCCYCERRVNKYDDVEHFRPKACWQQGPEEPTRYPGYYALAYDWNNLLVSCDACNREFKRNLFPLAVPQQRANLHHADATQESPLLIDPALQDPEQFISFRGATPFAIDANPIGVATIETLGLNRRDDLTQQRRESLDKLTSIRETLRVLEASPPFNGRDAEINKHKNLLALAVEDSSEFAAMARAAAKNDFLPFLP